MRFELRPNSKRRDNFNYVILKKDFLIFKKGEVIWAHHYANKKAFYCDYKDHNRSAFRNQNKKHLNYFYSCALPMVGTTWVYAYLRFTITKFESFNLKNCNVIATSYDRSKRENVCLNKYDMSNLINFYLCENIYSKRVGY